ncbi:MAG: T9SS type A sorting domain-containing protein [Bacteroidota bacterium]|nr:T9SS type A sorting domain-containing protein [Bacteroidota bacterium]
MFLFTGSASAQNDSSFSSNHSQNYLAAVNLGKFTGGYSSGFVQLRWATTNEKDVSHFEVERSTDGTNFRQIGKVLAKADVTSSEYDYLDILAEKGSNFYRLVVIDKDGNYTYSKAITISVENKGISLMLVYPNPFSKKVQVRINGDYPEQVTIRIVDNAGAVVRTQLAQVQQGENNIGLKNVDDLLPGIYYLEVIMKDKKMKTKLMKQQ